MNESVDLSEVVKPSANNISSLLSPLVPTLADSADDVVLRQRYSSDPNQEEHLAKTIIHDTERLEYTHNGNVEVESLKSGCVQELVEQVEDLSLVLQNQPERVPRILPPPSPETRPNLPRKLDPPIEKKKVPGNPFYAMRYRSYGDAPGYEASRSDSESERDRTLTEPKTIENVRSQSLTPTALAKSPYDFD